MIVVESSSQLLYGICQQVVFVLNVNSDWTRQSMANLTLRGKRSSNRKQSVLFRGGTISENLILHFLASCVEWELYDR